jgi:photosystem II stability/assembly factor-like uncharacterized protein/transcriptional regulator with XRE-family HTH domain
VPIKNPEPEGTFGRQLYDMRTCLGLTSNDLAKPIDVDPSLISHWEHNRKEPARELLLKLVAFFARRPGCLERPLEAQEWVRLLAVQWQDAIEKVKPLTEGQLRELFGSRATHSDIEEALALARDNWPEVQAPRPSPPLPSPPRPGIPFIGPVPFRSSDADVFYGRTQCVNELMTKIEDLGWPLLIVNGQSGAGKTSLLRAGLVPRLRKSGYEVVYASILDSPQSDVLWALRDALPVTEGAPDILEAVRRIGRQPDLPHCLVLIVDQVERCFTIAQDSKEWIGFWQDMGRLMRGETQCSTKVLFAIRADWLHAFQRISPEALAIPVFNFLYLVDPLTTVEAKEAFVKPFERFGVQLGPKLTDTVVEELTDMEGRVWPPQLQIVGARLYGLLMDPGRAEDRRLTLQDYKDLNGAGSIIREHLANTVNSLGPNAGLGWSILLNLVGPRNQRMERREQDLRGNLSVQEFERIAGHLINARLIVRELSAASGAPVFILTHDYLIEEITDHFKTDPRLSQLQTARNYLSSGLIDWHEAKRTSGQEVLLDGERYRHIYSQRQLMGGLAGDVYEFLALSALQNGDPGFGEWMTDLPSERVELVLTRTVDFCLAETGGRRHAAQEALLKAIQKGLLSSEHQKRLQVLFWKELTTPGALQTGTSTESPVIASAAAERRDDTIRMLWALRSQADRSDLVTLAPAAARIWVDDHRTELIVGATASFLIIAALLAFSLIRRWQEGTWHEVDTLKAGEISAVAPLASADDTIYMVTPRGPASRDSASLFQRTPTEGWQLISRSFTNRSVPGLVAAHSGGSSRIYAVVRGTGMLRSDDGGSHWETINEGLRSYEIRVVVVDPDDSDTLYAGSGDKKGVFETHDGGRHWQDISGEEMFGASVLSMAYRAAGSGTILAGTDDGRIVAYDREDGRWQLLSAYAGVGAINVLALDSKEGEYVYAGTSTGNILVSTNGGSEWMLMGRPSGVFRVLSIVVVPGQSQALLMDAYGVGGYVVWTSNDAGRSWQHVSDDRFTREPLFLYAGGRKVYAAGMAGWFETSDGGRSWEYASDIGAPLAIANDFAVSPVSGGPTYAVVRGSVYSALEPERGGWVRANGLPAEIVRDIEPDPVRGDVAFAGIYQPGKWSVYYTTDRGVSWQPTTLPDGIPERDLNDTSAIAVSATDGGSIIYAGTIGCGVLRSADGGVTWDTWGRKDCSPGSDAPKDVIDLAIDPVDHDIVYAAADTNRVYVSTDGGRNWQAHPTTLSAEITAIAADPKVPGRLYLVAGADGFWRSDDGATTWKQMGVELLSKSVRTLVVVPGLSETVVVASTDGNVWLTTDGGLDWRSLNNGLILPGISALAVANFQGGLLVGSNLGGIYRYQPGEWPHLER